MKAVRISKDIAAAAEKEAKAMRRSMAGQIEHWAELGRAVEDLGLSTADIKQLHYRGHVAAQNPRLPRAWLSAHTPTRSKQAPEDKQRHDAAPALNNATESRAISRKSEQLGLSFPYDWSNPAISDEALILNVMERGIYEDICRVCAYYGMDEIERQRSALPPLVAESPSLNRMLSNIGKGFSRAQAR